MSAHTPGPWQYDARRGRIACVEYDLAEVLPGLAALRPDSDPDADGRLIAAAPELLDAAVFARDTLRAVLVDYHRARGDAFEEERSDEIQMLNAAIAKAKGFIYLSP